ncbi:MAG: RsmE family RNA methyltransferase [Ginsengibacter sp.]
MQLPYFFEESLPVSERFFMSEESSRHIVQVLRMKINEQLTITNGNGKVLTATLITSDKKSAEVKIISSYLLPATKPKISIAISLIKNANRFEWFLEKATEIGVNEIIPLISGRTEKQHFRLDRMKKIIVSAMLQSQQTWLPLLNEPVKYADFVNTFLCENKFIAHCEEQDQKRPLRDEKYLPGDGIILIGPEGDFTKPEIDLALQNNYKAVSLGETRLRTETAAIVAAVLLLNRKM